MADLVITAASVVKGANARIDRNGYAGSAITAGQAVVKNSAGLWVPADSNSGTAGLRAATGIALNGTAANQPVDVQTDGSITLNAVLTPGVAVYLSDTPGGLCLVADVGSGEYAQVVGIATSTTVLKLGFAASGVAL